jgi:hypothetical protein
MSAGNKGVPHRNYVPVMATGARLHRAGIEVLQKYLALGLAKPGETLALRLIQHNREMLRKDEE